MLEITGLLLVVAAGWLWLDSVKARDGAIFACRRACDSEGLQFLDDSVSVSRLKVERDDEGVLRLRRVHDFEYSDTGDNRHPGSIVMLGHRVLALHLDLHGESAGQSLH